MYNEAFKHKDQLKSARLLAVSKQQRCNAETTLGMTLRREY